MRHCLTILSVLVAACVQLPAHGAEVTSADFSIKPFEENSTDIFSILEILIEAREAYTKNDYEAAALNYGILVKYDLHLEEAVVGLAKTQIALRRSDLAKRALSQSSISTPEMDILLTIATVMELSPKDAEPYLIKSLDKHQDSRLWNLYGQVLGRKGQWEEASKAFHKAEEENQKPGLLYNNLGLLALQAGDTKLALNYIERAVSSSPNTIKFDSNRRLILLFKGRYYEALKGLSPDRSIDLVSDAAIIAHKRGETELATTLIQKAMAMNPSFNAQAQKTLKTFHQIKPMGT